MSAGFSIGTTHCPTYNGQMNIIGPQGQVPISSELLGKGARTVSLKPGDATFALQKSFPIIYLWERAQHNTSFKYNSIPADFFYWQLCRTVVKDKSPHNSAQTL